MELISSIHNQKVKNWVKLHTKKGREATQEYLIEGLHMIEEAIHYGQLLQSIILQEGIEPTDIIHSFIGKRENHCYRVSTQVMQKISQTDSPQGILAIVRMKEGSSLKLLEDMNTNALILVLDAIQDPGNLGTMIRTADAAGFEAVVLGDGTVDLYNPKVLRSTMGSVFHIPIIQEDLSLILPKLRQEGYRIAATSLEGAIGYAEPIYEGPTVIIIGNEAKGVSSTAFEYCTHKVKIPIYGQAESLNAAIAASIIMYEAVRQRNF